MQPSPRALVVRLALCIASGLLLSPFAHAASQADWFQPNPAWSAVDAVAVNAGSGKLTLTPGDKGEVMVIAEAGAKSPHLRTKTYAMDCLVSVEYLYTAGTKAGLFLASAYRIQLDGQDAGTVGPMQSYEGKPDAFLTPVNIAATQPGTWHKLEARLRAPRYNEAGSKTQKALLIELKIDGVVVHDNAILNSWCRGTETEWESNGGNVTFSATNGSLALRNFSLQRADFTPLMVPATSGGATNVDKLVDYVKQGADLFKALGCVECHATQQDDTSQKTGPNLFGLFRLEPRDREIAGGEGHRFTIKADRSYLLRSVRTPFDELAIAEHGPNRGTAYLPAMPPILPTVATDAQVDAIGTYLATLNEPANQGPVVKLVTDIGLENYDPMADRLQLLVAGRVRLQRGPMERLSGRTIHVGLPGGINYSFDPRLLAIAQLWQGGFLDMSGEFLNRGGGGIKPGYESREIKLGAPGTLFAPLNSAGRPVDLSATSPVFHDDVKVKELLNSPRDLKDLVAEADAQFLGYERDSTSATAAPAFKYRVGRNTIAVRTEFAADGGVRLVIDGDFATAQAFAINTGVLADFKVPAGQFQDGRWSLPAGQHRNVTATAKVALATNAWHAAPSPFAFPRQPLVKNPSSPDLPRGYSAEAWLAPKDNYGRDMLFEALGMALAPDGTIVVATRTAGIWRLVKGEWQLFAEGLFDSLGVQVEDQHGLVVVAGQKAELTRISDTNGDGLADKYETLSDAFTYTGNYHAYMHGPVRDRSGDYFVTLNLNDSSTPGSPEYKAGGRYMGTSGGYRGWAIRVPKAGGFEPYADGLRSPAGLGVAPDERLWYADNQGEFVGTSKLFVLQPGKFYGHPSGLVDRPGMTPASPEIAWDKVSPTREKAVVLFPQGRLANSPGNPAWDTTGGKFGPFAGQMFLGDQTQSNLMRVGTEVIGGQEQGFAINFSTNLESGVMRPLFLPDGSMLLGETGRGWQAKGGHVTSVQHVRWDGKTVPPSLHHVSAVAGGFDLVFTAPVPAGISDADVAAALVIRSWVYRDAPDYGSPELDEHDEAVTAVKLSPDRLTLHVTLAKTEPPVVHPQQSARVYRLTVSGQKLWNDQAPGLEAFYTLYAFPAAK